MPQRTVRVETPWAPERLFAYLADLRNFAEWDPGVRRAVLASGPTEGAGAAFDLTVGGGMVLRYVTEVYEPPRRLVVRARTAALESLDEIEVVGSGDGSVVTYTAGLVLLGWRAVGNPVLGLMFGRIVRQAADGLCRVTSGRLVS